MINSKNAKLIGTGEFVKGSAYQVYELEGRYYSIIVNLLDNIQTIKNKYHKLIFKGFASYWLGIVFSLALLASLELLNCFVTLPYLEYLTDNNLFLLSLLIAMPLGYVSKILIKNYIYLYMHTK
jgi:hypothetical protein